MYWATASCIINITVKNIPPQNCWNLWKNRKWIRPRKWMRKLYNQETYSNNTSRTLKSFYWNTLLKVLYSIAEKSVSKVSARIFLSGFSKIAFYEQREISAPTFETDFSTKLLVLNYTRYNLPLETLLKVQFGANWNYWAMLQREKLSIWCIIHDIVG